MLCTRYIELMYHHHNTAERIHTRLPKSVWAPMPALSALAGVLTQRASPPLSSEGECRLRSSPSGRPRRFSKIFRKVLQTSKEFLTNGEMTSSIRSLIVAGYVRHETSGHEKASFCATLKNSLVSKVPFLSVTILPRALYLRKKYEYYTN